jgi:hypothetical protein
MAHGRGRKPAGAYAVLPVEGANAMKRALCVTVAFGLAVLVVSCSSFPYFTSDAYLQAGIRVTMNREDVSNLHAVNLWSSVFERTLSAQEIGVWAANRLAQQGRHDLIVLIELVPVHDLHQNQNLWRISMYPISPEDKAK